MILLDPGKPGLAIVWQCLREKPYFLPLILQSICKFTCFCKISSSFLARSTSGDGTAGWGTILNFYWELYGRVFLSRFFRQMLKRDFLVFRLDFRLDWFSCYRVVGVVAGERGLACKLPENNQQIGNRGTATLLRGKLPPHRSLGCKQDTQTLSATCCKGEPQLYRVKLDIHY